MNSKKARAQRRKWLRSPEGREYVRKLRERTPEDAQAMQETLKAAGR